jgi:FHS family L-fucose permease-like MFS transporter
MASGVTLLQVAANPLIASMGKPEESSFRLNLSQAFNSLGAACGLWFGANFLLKGDIFKKDVVVTDVLREQALGFVSNVYLVIGLGLALFILLIYLVRQKITDAAPKTGHLVNPFTALTSKWANLGAIGIFLYVGAEVAISLHLLLFLEQTRILDIPSEQAGKLTTFYMVFAMIGRFGGSALLKVVKDYFLLAFVAVGAIALCLVVILTKDMTPTAHAGSVNLLLASAPMTSGLIPAFAALLIGLFNSIMFPTIFTLTLQRSSAPTSATSGLLCMAIVGGAFLPLAFAKIEEMTGSISMGFIAPLVCYVYVLWFAFAAKKAPTHEITEEVASGH